MKNITKKGLNRIAKEYGYDPQYLEDQVLDWESDGIKVDTQDSKTTVQRATSEDSSRPSSEGRHPERSIYMNTETKKALERIAIEESYGIRFVGGLTPYGEKDDGCAQTDVGECADNV